jgi:hypothetical protein
LRYAWEDKRGVVDLSRKTQTARRRHGLHLGECERKFRMAAARARADIGRMKIQIAPLPEEFLTRVRTKGIDDLGQPVKRLVSVEGGEPCRDVLRRALPGEELILASFSPFGQVGPYHEYGPVFVLANADGTDSAARDRLPVDGYLRSQFVVRAYGADESIVDAAMVTPGDADDVIERFFASGDVAFVHARFPVYGCFALRIDR